LNLETGKLEGHSLSNNSGNIETHYIYLYKVDSNLDIPSYDLLDEEEEKQLEESGLYFYDFCEKHNIDIRERTIQALEYRLDNKFALDDFEEDIKQQLDEIYDEDY